MSKMTKSSDPIDLFHEDPTLANLLLALPTMFTSLFSGISGSPFFIWVLYYTFRAIAILAALALVIAALWLVYFLLARVCPWVYRFICPYVQYVLLIMGCG